MQSSSIEWCTATWNPIRGCRRIGKGCIHCYAEKTAARFNGEGKAYENLTTAGRWNGNVKVLPNKFDEPLRWKDPERIFVNSMSDLFYEEFDAETVVAPIFATMSRAKQHTFIVLTKRYERAARLTNDPAFVRAVDDARGPEAGDFAWPLPNVILGGSLSDQEELDRHIVDIFHIKTACRVVSLEPLIGPMRLDRCAPYVLDGDESNPGVVNAFNTMGYHPRTVRVAPPTAGTADGIQWVIVGGESGAGARPCNVEWIRSIVRQCQVAQVPVFCKQLGADVIDRNDAGFEGDLETFVDGPDAGQWTNPSAWPHQHAAEDRIEHLDPQNWQGAPVRIHLRDRKGGDLQEWPLDLRVRQMPEVRA